MLDILDYGTSRKIGRSSYLQSSIILDGKFNANAFFQIGDDCRVQGCENLFSTTNLDISCRNIAANNLTIGGNIPSYQIQIFVSVAGIGQSPLV